MRCSTIRNANTPEAGCCRPSSSNGSRKREPKASRKLGAIQIVSGGQIHDSQVMPDLLNGAGRSAAVVADKAYGSNMIRQHIADQGALAVIPSKSNARNLVPLDQSLY